MPHFFSDPHMDTFIQKCSDRTNGRFCFKLRHMYAARYCDDFPSNLLASFREQLVISKFRHKTLTTFRQLFRGHTEKRINRQKIDCSEKLPTKISENLTTNPVRRISDKMQTIRFEKIPRKSIHWKVPIWFRRNSFVVGKLS